MKIFFLNEENKYSIYLFLIVAANFLFYFIIHPRFVLSDDFVYAKNAFDIFNGQFKLHPHHFYNRFAVFVPVGILFKLFGVNDFTLTLWPFIINIATIITSYYFVKKNFSKEVAIISTFFIGFNFTQINWGLELAPDVIMSYFVILSIYLLYEVRINNKKEILYGILFVISFFIAFLAKENIITAIPFLFIVFLNDLLKKKNLKFWITAIIFGIIVLSLYFLAYQVKTGDFYYRFNGIENGHNLNDDSYVGRPELLIRRLLYLPILMFIDNIYFYVLIVFSIPVMIIFLKNNKSLDNPTNYFALYELLLFLCFWFGSTSLKHYNPFLHRMDRTWMMMIVPLSILAAIALNNFFKEIDFKKITLFSLYSILFFFIALTLNIFLGNKKKIFVWILLILFFGILFFFSCKKTGFKLFNFRYSILLIVFIVTLGFSYTTKNFYNYLELKNVFNKYFNPYDKSKILIITFPRMVEDYSYFYKFNNPR